MDLCPFCNEPAIWVNETFTAPSGLQVEDVRLGKCPNCSHSWLPSEEELRIDILSDNYSCWIRIPRYKDDPSLSWEARYHSLENHHMDETQFLINFIKQLLTETPRGSNTNS